ncbi:tetratricopeptide repeat protein [Amycolatopsis benzoatilytica]|uniref:tetratricopeptide repeat protein n=1 Tax=Amycolatopsis benzoatilytica TaxID=346045 RepID=UPI001FDEC7B8|nr:tetratricopeptide repeat protein [Amycolatopsis benzoatilytica]
MPILRSAVAAAEPDAPRLLALTLMESGDKQAAADVLVQAVAAGQTHLAGLLGDVADDLGNAELAESSYRQAIAAGDSDALNDYGTFLRGQERYDEAIAAFTRAIHAGDALAPGNLVRLHLHDLEDVDTAERLGRQYLDEAKPTTYTALADVCAQREKLDEAEEMYRKSVALKAPKAHINYANFLWEERDDDVGAERELRLAKEEDEPGWGYELGFFLAEHDRTDDARDVLEHAASWGDLDARELLDDLDSQQ